MTQEDKNLLLKDLCARLSYKVKVEAKGLHKTIEDDYNNRGIIAHVLIGLNLRDSFKTYSIDYSDKIPLFNRKGDCNIKPYLFPLSSISEEQRKYISDRWGVNEDFDFEIDPNWGEYFIDLCDVVDFINWCYENHFDINFLILKGSALDATGLNIY